MSPRTRMPRSVVLPLFLLLLFTAHCTAAPFIDDALYPAPMADPLSPRFSLTLPVYLVQAIDTLQGPGDTRLRESLQFGGSKSLVRIGSSQAGGLALELSLGAGITALFDSFEDGLDAFGWEGSGSLTVNLRLDENVRLRVGLHHLSSHVSDEYLANYGVLPLPITSSDQITTGSTYGMNYVRDSLLMGISVQPFDILRLYAQGLYSFDMIEHLSCYNDFPWQLQGGAELSIPTASPLPGFWYLAVDTSAYQESSWLPGISLQLGLGITQEESSQRLRIGLEYYQGRAQIAAFNHTDSPIPTSWEEARFERYLALGAWYEF